VYRYVPANQAQLPDAFTDKKNNGTGKTPSLQIGMKAAEARKKGPLRLTIAFPVCRYPYKAVESNFEKLPRHHFSFERVIADQPKI